MPITSVTMNPTNPSLGQYINFSAMIGGNIISKVWTFSDNTSFSGLNITKAFMQVGPAWAKFTLTEKNGKITPKTLSFNVAQNVPPPPLNATISGPNIIMIGTPNHYSINITGGTSPYNIQWSACNGTGQICDNQNPDGTFQINCNPTFHTCDTCHGKGYIE